MQHTFTCEFKNVDGHLGEPLNFYYDLLYICWLTKPYEAISYMNKERVNIS